MNVLVKCLVLLMLVAAFLVAQVPAKAGQRSGTYSDSNSNRVNQHQIKRMSKPRNRQRNLLQPTEEPTPEPTEEPDPVIHIQDDFSDPEKSKNEWELQAFKVETVNLLQILMLMHCKPGCESFQTSPWQWMVFLEHKPDTENYIGCWIGPKLMESKIIAGFWPKDKKVKILENNKDGTRLLKDATVSEIGLNEEFHLAIKLTSDNTIKIYINKQLVLEHTNTSLYKHDNIGFFWNNNNHIAIDNLVLADEHYHVEQ